MGLLDGLFKKVVEVLQKSGKFTAQELKTIKDVLEKRKRFARIVSKATIATIISNSSSNGKLNKEEFTKKASALERIIMIAMTNTYKGNKAFDESARKQLEKLFNDMGLNGKDTARKFIYNFDLAFAQELSGNITQIKEKIELNEQNKEIKPKKVEIKEEAEESKEKERLTA